MAIAYYLNQRAVHNKKPLNLNLAVFLLTRNTFNPVINLIA